MSLPAPIAQLQDTVSGWFRDRTSDRPEPTRQDLPPEAERSLKDAIAALPPHPTHCKAVADAIVQSLAAQPDESEERNALVVLSTPAESLVPILQVALQQPELAELPVVTLDSFASRAIQPAAVLTELRQTIETLPVPASLPRPDAQAETVKIAAPDGCAIAPREIAAIPALSECFVRCIEGMNGIEALWTTLSRDTSRFWVVGCNQWAWNYLERTTRISSYFTNTLSLAPLTGEDLQSWLSPTRSHLESALAEVEIPEWSEESDRQFFEALASATGGIASAAVSLYAEVWQLESEDGEETEKKTVNLKRLKPSRPRLPDLSNSDRYLLYSVLLHGGTDLQRLALSLGDTPSVVGGQIRHLLRSRVLVLNDDIIQLNPAYYAGLKSSLNGHNFLVD